LVAELRDLFGCVVHLGGFASRDLDVQGMEGGFGLIVHLASESGNGLVHAVTVEVADVPPEAAWRTVPCVCKALLAIIDITWLAPPASSGGAVNIGVAVVALENGILVGWRACEWVFVQGTDHTSGGVMRAAYGAIFYVCRRHVVGQRAYLVVCSGLGFCAGLIQVIELFDTHKSTQ